MIDSLVKAILYVSGVSTSSFSEEIRRVLLKNLGYRPDEKKEEDLLGNIDAITANLTDSRQRIDEALKEMEKQKEKFQELKEEAERNEALLKADNATKAIEDTLQKTLGDYEKYNRTRTYITNLVFALIGAVIGLVLAKLFP